MAKTRLSACLRVFVRAPRESEIVAPLVRKLSVIVTNRQNKRTCLHAKLAETQG